VAVAHDAASESHTGATGSINQASFSWTHTPVGTPRGVLIFAVNLVSTANIVTSVTYGGVTVPSVTGGFVNDSAGEPGSCSVFFLGSGIPTGARTVVVNRGNTADEVWAVCITVTANNDTDYAAAITQGGDGTLAEVNISDFLPGGSPASMRYCGGYSGLTSPPAPLPGATQGSSTGLQNFDTGAQVAAVCRETTGGTGSRPVGFTSGTTDDRAFVYLAVREARLPIPDLVMRPYVPA
jgi:hypothetical protein